VDRPDGSMGKPKERGGNSSGSTEENAKERWELGGEEVARRCMTKMGGDRPVGPKGGEGKWGGQGENFGVREKEGGRKKSWARAKKMRVS